MKISEEKKNDNGKVLKSTNREIGLSFVRDSQYKLLSEYVVTLELLRYQQE